MPQPARPRSTPPSRRKTALYGAASVAVGLVVLVLLLIRPGFNGPPAPTPGEIRTRAFQAMQKSDWERAGQLWATLPDPTPADWLERARTALAAQKYDEALEFVEHGSNDARPAIAAQSAWIRGQVAVKTFQASKAESLLLKALELDPKLSPARRLLIYLYGTQERRSAMLEQFAAIATHGPLTLDMMQDWCLTRAGLGDLAQGISDLRKFLKNDAEDRMSRLALASMLRQSGAFDEADATLKPLAADDLDAIAERASILLDRGQVNASATLLATAQRPHPKIARLRARLALGRKDASAAVSFFKEADRLEPGNRETWLGLANALRLQGSATEAAAVTEKSRAYDRLRARLQDVREKKIASKEAVLEMAGLCETAGMLDEAVAWYRLLLTLEPLNSEAQAAIYRLSKPK